LYAPDLGADQSLRMGVVAAGSGLGRVWAHGAADSGGFLASSVTDVLSSASLDQGYPVTVSERFGYAMAYNPSSPLVLGPGLLVLVLVGGAIYLATVGRKDPYADLDDA
jgi:hypothetical protein